MAASTADYHLYADAFNRLSTALTAYINDVATNVIGAISGVAYSMLTVYIMLWGWAMFRGLISEPVMDGATRLIRLSLIVGIALNLGRYNAYVSDFLWNSPDTLASYVASGYSNPVGNVQYLDQLLSKLFDLGDAYWQKAGTFGGIIPDIGLMVIAVLIWAAGIAATGYGAFLLALSKMAMAILLGLGPLFVLFVMFEGTKRFFESWLGQVLNYLFLIVLSAAAIKLILTIIDAYLGATAATTQANPTVQNAIPAIVLCVIGALVMMQIPSIASALGGGVAISTLGAVGYSYAKAKGGLVAMRPTNLRRSYMRARSDARIVGNAIGAPRRLDAAVYRRITGGAKNSVTRG